MVESEFRKMPNDFGFRPQKIAAELRFFQLQGVAICYLVGVQYRILLFHFRRRFFWGEGGGRAAARNFGCKPMSELADSDIENKKADAWGIIVILPSEKSIHLLSIMANAMKKDVWNSRAKRRNHGISQKS